MVEEYSYVIKVNLFEHQVRKSLERINQPLVSTYSDFTYYVTASLQILAIHSCVCKPSLLVCVSEITFREAFV